MIHLNRSTWSALAAMGIVLLAILAGCWVMSRRGAPPPAVFVTRTPTRMAIPITVRPVTLTPVPISPTAKAPTPTPSALAPQVTKTFTSNPSTLITPSPQVLPGTGGAQNSGWALPMLACGMALVLGGMVLLWVRKPKG